MSSLAPYAVLASEAAGEPAINIWVVGALTLTILLILLAVVVGIGGGRDHS